MSYIWYGLSNRTILTTRYISAILKCGRQNELLLRNQPLIQLLCTKSLTRQVDNKDILQKYPNVAKYLEKIKINWYEVAKIIENKDNKDDVSLLLQCCNKFYPHYTPTEKAEICNEIWTNLQLDNSKLKIEHYNTYLETCLENGKKMNSEEFLNSLQIAPNDETYKLLLEIICEDGNIDEALNLLKVMKEKRISVDERIFNSLVLCHTIYGGVNEGKEVIKTMKTTQIPLNKSTNWSLLRGVAYNKNLSDFKDVLLNTELIFNPRQFFKFLTTISQNKLEDWLPLLKNSLKLECLPKEHLEQLEKFCINLIHQNNSDSAYKIFCTLNPPSRNEIDNTDYGVFLLAELLKTGKPVDALINFAKNLISHDCNKLALFKTTELTLINGYFDVTWKLFENLEELRPHYFWPLLLSAGRKGGEIEVINTLNKMISFNVQPDYETLEFYCLNSCNLTQPESLLHKLLKLGLQKKLIVPSLVVAMMQKGYTHKAYKFYATNEIPITNERLFIILAKSWDQNQDIDNTLLLLQKLSAYSQHNFDPIGTFLIHSYKNSKRAGNYDQYLNLLQVLHKKHLKVSVGSSEELFHLLQSAQNFKYLSRLESLTEKITNFKSRGDKQRIIHPKNMDVEELECHLTELQSKNMDTRGIIRKLIQEHVRLKNYPRAQKLRNLFIELGYEETPGILSSMLHSYTKSQNLTVSMQLYNELKTKHEQFQLDDYKVIDLTALIVQEGTFEDAMKFFNIESKNRIIRASNPIQHNCLHLVNSAKNPKQANILFNSLLKYNYCKPTNVMLGGVLKSYIRAQDIPTAVDVYTQFAEEYKCTPLQFELLLETVKEENRYLLEKVMDVTTKIHGATSARCALVGALAQQGMQGPLKNLLLDGKTISEIELNKRYNRWVSEERLSPLQTLIKVAENMPSYVFDLNPVYLAVLKIYSLRDDCEGAMELWRSLQEKEVETTQELQIEYYALLERCKYLNTSSSFVTVNR